jgi:hypothetical protein
MPWRSVAKALFDPSASFFGTIRCSPTDDCRRCEALARNSVPPRDTAEVAFRIRFGENVGPVAPTASFYFDVLVADAALLQELEVGDDERFANGVRTSARRR